MTHSPSQAIRHLSMEELLAVRDGERQAAHAEHLLACGACRTQLEAMRATQSALRELPLRSPPADGWDRLAARAQQDEALRQQRRRFVRTVISLAAAAALVAALWDPNIRAGLPGLGGAGSGTHARAVRAASTHSAEDSVRLVALKDQSRELEQELDELGAPQVLDAQAAGGLFELEDQLRLIDLHLAQPPDERRIVDEEILWRARVHTLQSLLQERLRQGGYVSL